MSPPDVCRHGRALGDVCDQCNARLTERLRSAEVITEEALRLKEKYRRKVQNQRRELKDQERRRILAVRAVLEVAAETRRRSREFQRQLMEANIKLEAVTARLEQHEKLQTCSAEGCKVTRPETQWCCFVHREEIW